LTKLIFSDIIIKDAGTGTGSTTLLCKKIGEARGEGKIVSVDIYRGTLDSEDLQKI